MNGAVEMFVLIWRYRVVSGKHDTFMEAYGQTGVWTGFFARGAGYVRTELYQDPTDAASFITLDFWESREAFAAFQKAHHAEYRDIDASCDGLTEAEVFVGAFQVTGTDPAVHYGTAARKNGGQRGHQD